VLECGRTHAEIPFTTRQHTHVSRFRFVLATLFVVSAASTNVAHAGGYPACHDVNSPCEPLEVAGSMVAGLSVEAPANQEFDEAIGGWALFIGLLLPAAGWLALDRIPRPPQRHSAKRGPPIQVSGRRPATSPAITRSARAHQGVYSAAQIPVRMRL
jgi:hypothetical protein